MSAFYKNLKGVFLSSFHTAKKSSSMKKLCLLTSLVLSFYAGHSQGYLLQEDFEGSFPPTGWTIYNETGGVGAGTGSGYDWIQNTSYVPNGAKTMTFHWTAAGINANAWAFTPAFSLTAGTQYFISFKQVVAGATFPENLKVTAGTAATIPAQTSVLLDLPSLTNTTTANRLTSFTPASSGIYYFAFNCYSIPDRFYLSVDSINIFSYTPCVTPAAQATSLNLAFAGSNVNGSFTAAAPAADKYLILRTPGLTALNTSPVNGTAYTAGGTLGNGLIIGYTNSTSFVDNNAVTTNTTYTYTIFSASDGGCLGAPFYLTTSPLTTSFTTPGCAAATGTFSVGPTGTYATITAALAALNATGVSGNVTLELQSTYTSAGETFPLTVPNFSAGLCSSSPSLTIRPAAGAAALSITSANATATIDLNGSKSITIDGRPGGVGSSVLTIENTNTNGLAVRFINDAVNNNILYTTVKGVNSSATGGVVQFATTSGTTGNDNNTLAFCNIGDGATTPASLIVSAGSTGTTAQYNSGNTITNCNLYNFWLATGENNAFKLSAGTTGWTIVNNSVYQTASRTATSSLQQYIFNLNNTNGTDYIISGNFIGGSAANCGGTPWTATGSGTGVSPKFTLSYFNFATAATGNAVVFVGNTIANFDWTNPSTTSSTGAPGTWCGPQLINGGPAVITGNTIGSQSLTGSIIVKAAANTNVYGVISSSSTANTSNIITNNTIGGITTNTTGAASVANSITGIFLSSGASTMTYTVDGNTVGSAVADNMLAQTASTSAQSIKGIENTGSGRVIITNNTIRNLTNSAASTSTTASQVVGINTTSGADSIAGNTISNFKNAAVVTSSGASASVIGISQTSTTAPAYIIKNQVFSLANTGTTASVKVTGINISGPTSGTNVVSKNFVHSLSASSTDGTSVIAGLNVNSGNQTCQNNMIRVGIDANGNSITTGYFVYGINESGGTNNYYYNSIYAGGSGVVSVSPSYGFYSSSSSTTARTIQDNIIYNGRSNASGTANNFSIRVPNTTNLSCNNNVYYVNGTGGLFGVSNATNCTDIVAWRTATGLDAASGFGDPQFLAPAASATSVNLHLNTAVPTPAEGNGVNVASVTDDYDGDIRAGLTPTDIGADAGNFITQDIIPPTISYTLLTNTNSTSNRTTSGFATITDAAGINLLAGTKPRLYYKRSTDANAYVDNTSGTNGWKYVEAINVTTPFDFTIDYSLLNGGTGVVAGNNIQYFVVAQDLASTPNISVNSGGFAVVPSSVALTPTAFPISGTINSYTISFSINGTYSVGTGQTYTSLTGVGGFFAFVNSNIVSGNVIVNVTSNLTEDGTNTLNKTTESGAGGYNISIRPDAAVERLIAGTVGSPGMIKISGAQKVSFDGRFGGSGKYLRIRNVSTGGPAIVFLNDAKRDSISYCYVEGNNTSTGNIFFGSTNLTLATGGSGNDSNVLLNNVIRDRSDAAGVPTTLLNSGGNSTAGLENSDNLLIGNEFLNYSANAINITSTGNGNNWQITNNSFYQTATRSSVINTIIIAAGSGHTISGNSIGGAAADRSGVATTTSNAASGLGFSGINLSLGTTSTTIVQNNTISNISLTSSGGFYGIYVQAGAVNVTGNIIGGGTQPYDTIRNGYDNGGIFVSGGTVSITGNTIGNIAYYRVSNDRTAGIYIGGGTNTISGNTLRDIKAYTTASTSFFPMGIQINGGSNNIVEGNTISNIFNISGGTDATWAVGLFINTTGTTTRIDNNKVNNVYTLGVGTGTSSSLVYGIYVNNANTQLVYGNQISVGLNTVGEARVIGIGDPTSSTTHSYYNNTVNIMGNTTAGANNSYAFLRTSSAVMDLRNNIFSNTRTTAGTGFNYAVGNTSGTPVTGWSGTASNYNLFYTTDATHLGEWGAGNAQTLAQWRTSSLGDVNSVTGVVPFVSSTNVHIDNTNPNCWNVNGRGTSISSVATDLDGDARSIAVGKPTDIGADEFSTSTIPADAVESATPAVGTTTTYTSAGRKVAEISWGPSGTPPTSMSFKYYPGVPPGQGTNSNSTIWSYYDVTPVGGSGFSYDIKLYYTAAENNAIPDANERIIKRDAPAVFTAFASTPGSDAAGNYVNTTGFIFSNFSQFSLANNAVPLAIKLLAFNGENKGSANNLYWNTATEENGGMFEVEQSADGKEFHKIGAVNGIGRPSAYNFVDRQPYSGITYYRLNLKGATGESSYSNTIAIAMKGSNAFAIQAYPNPVTDQLTIRLVGDMGEEAQVQISDVSGKTVRIFSLTSSQTTIDMSSFAPGLYFVKYSDKDHSQTIKVNKQ
jgi:hypothetical protein